MAQSRELDMLIAFAKKLAHDVEQTIRDDHEDKGPQRPSFDEPRKDSLPEAPSIEFLATLGWEPNMLTNEELKSIIVNAVPTCSQEKLAYKTRDQLIALIEWLIDWWLSESVDVATDKVQDDDVLLLESRQAVPKSPKKDKTNCLEPQAQQDAMFGIASPPKAGESSAKLSPWDCFTGYDRDLVQKAERVNLIAVGGHSSVYQVSLFHLDS